jgi:imidazolonepropionase-like amidohydrolase
MQECRNAEMQECRNAGCGWMTRRVFTAVVLASVAQLAAAGQDRAGGNLTAPALTVLRPARVFDGVSLHEGWAARVRGNLIDAVGPLDAVAAPGATVIDLPGATLLPGLVEGHSHVLLHPYDEASWDDQVAHESLSLRVARATNHLRETLMAGFTTIRDLGTEGAGYADVGLRQAVAQGIIPGPRVLASTRAIVATGSYGPGGFASDWTVPQAAEDIRS